MLPVTFVLVAGKLITVRYHEPRVFKTFPQRAEQVSLGCNSGDLILVALLEALVDRNADVLERAQRDVDAISREIFATDSTRAARDFQRTLRLIGRKGDLVSHLRDSLVSLLRLTGFLSQAHAEQSSDKEPRGRIKTIGHDIQALTDQTAFLSQKITFLLDATLGLVNIEQNNIIKIFTIAAGVFLPPTLIASVYGMNFVHMPELRWPLGYPLAVVAMVLSAVLPYWYFRRRGWL
jgi:magnesium transporter